VEQTTADDELADEKRDQDNSDGGGVTCSDGQELTEMLLTNRLTIFQLHVKIN